MQLKSDIIRLLGLSSCDDISFYAFWYDFLYILSENNLTYTQGSTHHISHSINVQDFIYHYAL